MTLKRMAYAINVVSSEDYKVSVFPRDPVRVVLTDERNGMAIWIEGPRGCELIDFIPGNIRSLSFTSSSIDQARKYAECLMANRDKLPKEVKEMLKND